MTAATTRSETVTAAPARSRGATAGLWTLQVLLALTFVGGSGLAGLAASCLVALMVGATGAQLFFLHEGYWYTPVIIGVLLAVVARGRRGEIAALVARR